MLNNILFDIPKIENEFILRKFIQENNVEINTLKGNNDILINSIENGASSNIVEYIIINGYNTLNYAVNPENIKTPLSSAIENNRFDIAELLIDYGADINYIPTDTIREIINDNNLYYVLNKGYDILSLIKNLIENNCNYFLNQILKYCIEYNLISTFRNDNYQFYSNNNPKEVKINFNKSFYEISIENKNYEALSIIYNYDSREKQLIINDLIEIFKSNKKVVDKEELLNSFENLKLQNFIDNQFLNILENLTSYTEDVNNIRNIIINSTNILELRNYIENNNVKLSELILKDSNKKDILIYAIKSKNSAEFLNFIIDQCLKEDSCFFDNCCNPNDMLYASILFDNFKISEFLVKKFGNKKFDLTFTWLLSNGKLNVKNLNFILYNNIHIDFIVASSYKYIYINHFQLLNKILKHYLYNNAFILNLLSHYKNKSSLSTDDLEEMVKKEVSKIEINYISRLYKIEIEDRFHDELNIVYKYDYRPENVKLNDLSNVLNKIDDFGKKWFIDELKNGNIEIPVNEKYLNCVMYTNEQEIIKAMIGSSDIVALNNYIINNDIVLTNFKEDLLVYAITNEASIEMIKFIISQYKSVNYCISFKNNNFLNETCSPLSIAISKNQFEIAELLLNKGADINYKYDGYIDIITKMYNDKMLNKKNLNFIIKNGFNHLSEAISILANTRNMNEEDDEYEEDSNDKYHDDMIIKPNITEIINEKKEFLKIILNYHIYDNMFILKLITFNKNKKGLSNSQLNEILWKEKSKVPLTNEILYTFVSNYNIEEIYPYEHFNCDDYGVLMFLNYGGITPEEDRFTEEAIMCDILKNIMNINKLYFIDLLIKLKTFDFRNFNIEKYINKILPWSNEYEAELNLMEYIEYDDVKRYFGLYRFNFLKYLMGVLLNKGFIDFRKSNLENILIRICQKFIEKMSELSFIMTQEDVEFLKYFIENALDSDSFDYREINFENILLTLSQLNYMNLKYSVNYSCDGTLRYYNFINPEFFQSNNDYYPEIDTTNLIKLFIKKSLHHKTFDITRINIKSILLILRQLNDSMYTYDFFVNELLNCSQFNTMNPNIINNILSIATKIKSY